MNVADSNIVSLSHKDVYICICSSQHDAIAAAAMTTQLVHCMHTAVSEAIMTFACAAHAEAVVVY